jgi:hypothetical protein
MYQKVLTAFAALTAATLSFAQGPTIGNCPVLPADNIWNRAIDKLPVSSSSATWVNTIGAGAYLHSDFGSGTYAGAPIGMPFVLVGGSQVKYPASFLYYTESDPGPYAVPLNAPIQAGSDRHAIAVDKDNCILYELFNSYPLTGKWSADSGAIYNLRSNALRPERWTSADAAGLPIFAGLVRYEEVLAGEIRHAIRITAPKTRRAYVWPARHYASNLTDMQYPPMGARFRLKASFDITPFSPEVQIILRALKKYGAILADNGAAWFISGVPDSRWDNNDLHALHNIKGSAFEAVDVSSLMIDPNSGQAKQDVPSIAVSPVSTTVVTQSNKQFVATFQNSTTQALTWSVNGITGGNGEVGYIDAGGRYSAPSRVPTPAQVTVRAATTSISGTAAVLVAYPAPVVTTVGPSPIPSGAFTITVNGGSFQSGAAVRMNGAALSTTVVSSTQLKATGTTPAGATSIGITVRNPDGQVSNTLTTPVTQTGSTGTTVAVTSTPRTATVRLKQTLQITATVSNTTNTRINWYVNSILGGNATVGTVTQTGLYTAPAAVVGPYVSIAAVSAADPSKRGYTDVTLVP